MTLAEIPFSPADLFPAGDYALHMKFRRGGIEDFFRNRDSNGLLEERSRWIEQTAFSSDRETLAETEELAASLGICARGMVELGRNWEPDLLILKPGASGQMELVGSAVCFPSSWAPEEKFGKALDFIHAPVPGLNEKLGAPVRQFMERIKPGISWERINWGLSRSPELNQHPKRNLPRLNESVRVDEVFFRAEYQSLVALPRSGGVLFGIRLGIEPLGKICEDGAMREGLARALRTMPEDMARYKGLATARGAILKMLNGNAC